MQNNRFVVLTGHLSNYPLSDLVGILRHQRKSGRLLIEYPKGPATFFFQDGELVDARLNDLTGLQAICVALAQPEAAFNFNPLIQTSRRSIDHSLQRVVSELLGCWDESAFQIESTASAGGLEGSASVRDASAAKTLQGRRFEPLALPPAPLSVVHRRSVLFAAAAVVITIGLSTVIAVTGGFKGGQSSSAPDRVDRPNPETQIESSARVALAEGANRLGGTTVVTKPNRLSPAMEHREEKRSKNNENNGSDTSAKVSPSRDAVASDERAKKVSTQALEPIKVVMQIENGRVLKASIANHKPGRDSYEALALRIARQRRYPARLTGGETVTISINRPE